MREILFRAIPIGKKKFVYGFFAKIGGKDVIIKVESENYWDEDLKKCNGNELVEVKPETVGQFTGLRDRNSKQIYEGDIVQYNKFKAVVKYGEYSATNCESFHRGFYLDWIKDIYFRNDIDYWAHGRIEVVGNVFDIPKLIGGKQNEHD